MDDGSMRGGARPVWQRGTLWLALALGSLVPFVLPTILPFNDLSNHIARHYVFLNYDQSAFLQHFYTVHWSLIGNLGIDLVVRAIGPLLGAELATRLAVAAIPPLVIAGIYQLSRNISGEVQPAALVAVPLAFNWPLITGFTNFCFAAALALNVLAWWVRLRRQLWLVRFTIFAPLGFVVWVAHTAGWGLLGLGVLAYELARACQPRFGPVRFLLVPVQTLPFALMFVVTALWRAGTSTGLGIVYYPNQPKQKTLSILSLFREQFVVWDTLAVIAFFALLAFFFVRGGRRVVWPALAVAIAYLLAFLVCPDTLFNSGFADRRLLPYGMLVLPLGIGVAADRLADPAARRQLELGAWAALAFVGLRIAVTTVVWARAAAAEEAHLAAVLDRIPRHARVFSLFVEACDKRWSRVGRLDHVQQFALVRREAMTNGIFQNSGLNQVGMRFGNREGPGFDPGMLSLVHDARCPVEYVVDTLQSALASFPRGLFDYVWIVAEDQPGPYDTRGLALVTAAGNDRLYRIER